MRTNNRTSNISLVFFCYSVYISMFCLLWYRDIPSVRLMLQGWDPIFSWWFFYISVFAPALYVLIFILLNIFHGQECVKVKTKRLINKALLVKWLVRLKDLNFSQGWWKKSTNKISQFFINYNIIFLERVTVIQGYFKSISWTVYEGTTVSFWLDRWKDYMSLACKYPSLFFNLQDQIILSHRLFQIIHPIYLLIDKLVGIYHSEWSDLKNDLSNVLVYSHTDILLWR
jgi:hypothetical protein